MKKLSLLAYFLISLHLLIVAGSQASALSVASFYFNTSLESDSSLVSPEIVRGDAALLQVESDRETNCKYSRSKGVSYSSMEGTFDYALGTMHTKGFVDLSEGVHKLYIRCRDSGGADSKELAVSFVVVIPVSAKITLSKVSPVNAGRLEIKLTTSKPLSETPLLAYSLDGSGYTTIPLFSSGDTWQGYIIILEDEEDRVASFKFSGKDLEGITGNEITSGGVFLVDTTKPATITTFKGESTSGSVKLTWHFPDDSKTFRIYRSTSERVDYTDYYVSTKDTTYTDTDVTKGTMYYYRVTAVDDAGNEGTLSTQVEASALRTNTTVSSTGLSPALQTLVDSVIFQVDLVRDTVNDLRKDFSNKDGVEQVISTNLKLDSEFDGALSELASLRRDLENYKLQVLSQLELEKKLDTAQLRLSTIKKKVPESVSIVDTKEDVRTPGDEELSTVLLELTPGSLGKTQTTQLKKSSAFMKNSGLKVSSKAYNLKLVYLDGGMKELSLFSFVISSSQNGGENVSYVQFIPKEIVESVSQMRIKNTDYQTLKEDPIISFSAGTKEIVYSLDKQVNLELLKNIKTVALHKPDESVSGNSITGYASFSGTGLMAGYSGVLIGLLVLSLFALYFYSIRKRNIEQRKKLEINAQIERAEKYLGEGKLDLAEEAYRSLSQDYKSFRTSYKRELHERLLKIHQSLKTARIKEKIEQIKSLVTSDPEQAAIHFQNLNALYNQLMEQDKAQLYSDYYQLKKSLNL